MTRNVSVWLCLFAVFVLVESQINVEVQEPKLRGFLDKITDTTVGLLYFGFNFFGKAVDRIASTFVSIEDRIKALLELFRKQLIKGIPELSIPVLDPLHINRIDFDVNHEAARVRGNVEDLTVRHISKFVIDKQKFSDLGGLRFRLDLNLTFPHIKVNGTYKIDGVVGNAFQIFGNGPFRINLIGLQVGTSTILKYNIPARLRVEKIDLNVKLEKLENHFVNLMNDEELAVIFNNAISRLAPELLDTFWPEIKPSVEEQVRAHINNILENATVVNLAKRLFNI